MSQRFQARQPEKAAGTLDGVDQTKNVIEDLRVIRIWLSTVSRLSLVSVRNSRKRSSIRIRLPSIGVAVGHQLFWK
jgi:hypothetical protein